MRFKCNLMLVTVLCGLIVSTSRIIAVDPGWETGSTSSESQNSSVSSSVVDSSSESSSGSDVSSNNSGSNESASESFLSDASSDSSSVESSLSESSSSLESNASSDSSSSSSSESTGAQSVSEVSYSKSELLRYLKKVYESKLNSVNEANNQRILENNNKGALELQKSYKKLLKEIKSGKITKEERQKLIESQKASLQKVLSQRLNNLYDIYNQKVSEVRNELNSLADSHDSDAKAVELNSKLVLLDYNLSKDSQKAYNHYDKELDALNKQVSSQPVKSKKQQRIDAKNSYKANLKAISAVDPDELTKENKARLKAVTSLNKSVKAQIEAGNITTLSEIDKMFV